MASRQHESLQFVPTTGSLDTFGGRLRKAFGGLTNREIAEKLGISKSAVTNYVQGRVPPPETLEAIAELTGCSLHWLIIGTGPQFVNANRDGFADDFQVDSSGMSARLRTIFPALTAEQIAEKLDLPPSTVRQYFDGRLPATEILAKIADQTGVSLSWLLTNKGPQWTGRAAQPGGERQSLSNQDGSEPRIETVGPSPEMNNSEERVLTAHMQLIIEQNNRIIQLLEDIRAEGLRKRN